MKTREHILYAAIYAAVEALPSDDDDEGFYRVRELLTLVRDNAPPPPSMMHFHALAAECGGVYSAYINGARVGHLHRKAKAEFLDLYRDGGRS